MALSEFSSTIGSSLDELMITKKPFLGNCMFKFLKLIRFHQDSANCLIGFSRTGYKPTEIQSNHIRQISLFW